MLSKLARSFTTMEVFVSNIDPPTDLPALKRAIASVLHGPDFDGYHTLPLNFEVSLLPARRAGLRCATLTLPSQEVGEHFLKEYGGYRPRQELETEASWTPLAFERGRYEPRPEVLYRIRKFPYVDPVHEEEQLKLARELRTHLVHVYAVQFGWDCRDDVFSVEYERHCPDSGRLGFDADRRQSRLKIHEDDRNVLIAIRASQILRASLGLDSESHLPVICFSLAYAPTYEEEDPSDIDFDDKFDMFDLSKVKGGSGPSRQRLSTLDDDHEIYAEFTSLSIRLVCEDEASAQEFRWICGRTHVPVHVGAMPTVRRDLFAQGTVGIYDNWLSTLPWEVAFQVDALARANILDLREILQLRTHLVALQQRRGPEWTAIFIRYFGQEASDPAWYKHRCGSVHIDILEELFSRCRRTFTTPINQDTREETFQSYHAKVTPSRLLLEGPFPERCNRVMRKYVGCTSNFLRVTFMDENRLQYRFDRDVDGHGFIRERFGTLLFNGLWIAGRHFKFLAYSQSALKNHSVWFVRDFTMMLESGAKATVSADFIIAGLGIFHNVPEDPDLIRCPARYGARIAQAFTTTDAAVEVEVDEVFPVDDVLDSEGRRSFTDGVGLVSRELASDIWKALQEKSVRHRRYGRCTPKAFQIRFQGYKSMLSVDYRLSGRAIGLRPSMKKFEVPHSMTIEIAAVFNKPGRFYLNRPLIMLLEGLKIQGGYDILKTLQDAIIKDTKEATKSFQ